MNKLYIVSVLVFASILSVNAEEVVAQRAIPTLYQNNVEKGVAMIRKNVGVNGQKTEGKGQATLVRGGAGQIILPQRQVPTTGDPVIDAQIKTLSTERETKIQAINNEYRIKMQILIGNRPLKGYPMMVSGSGTTAIGVTRIENGQVGSSTRENMMRRATGTPTSVPMMRLNGNNGQGQRPPVSQNINQFGEGIGAQFNSLFRGMFGGNN